MFWIGSTKNCLQINRICMFADTLHAFSFRNRYWSTLSNATVCCAQWHGVDCKARPRWIERRRHATTRRRTHQFTACAKQTNQIVRSFRFVFSVCLSDRCVVRLLSRLHYANTNNIARVTYWNTTTECWIINRNKKIIDICLMNFCMVKRMLFHYVHADMIFCCCCCFYCLPKQ